MVYKYAGKADLGKVIGIRNTIKGNHAFSEIIKLQFEKKMPYIALYLALFRINVA